MVMAAARTVDVGLQIAIFGFDRGFQFLTADSAIADFRLFEQEVDDLVLIEGGAQLGGGHRILADILHETLTILRAVLLGSLHDETVHFIVRNDDIVGLADFRQQQAQAHAAHGDAAIILLLGFHFGQSGFRIGFMAGFMLKLLPDLVEFGFHHAGRNVEVVRSRELVEQLALHVGAGQAVMLLLDLALEQILELVETFQTQRLGEVVVELGLVGVQHRLHGHVEGRGLAGEVRGAIIFGEGDFDGLFFALLHAAELLFEAGDELARTNLQLHAFGRTAFERFTVDLADEVDDQRVAVLRLVAGGIFFQRALLGRDATGLFLDLRVADFGSQALQLQTVDARGFDHGQNFQFHLDLRVLAELEAFVQLDRRLHRGTQLLVGDQLLNAFLDGIVERVTLQAFTMHLLDEVRRHLAGAEAGHAHLRRNRQHFLLNAGVDILRRDGHGVGALQALVQRLDSLHLFSQTLS